MTRPCVFRDEPFYQLSVRFWRRKSRNWRKFMLWIGGYPTNDKTLVRFGHRPCADCDCLPKRFLARKGDLNLAST